MDKKETLNQMLLSDEPIDKTVLFSIIPELSLCDGFEQNHPAHEFDVFTHTMKVVYGVRKDLILKLVALFHDIGKYEKRITVGGIHRFWGHEELSEQIAGDILTCLGYSEWDIRKICRLIKYHDYKIEPRYSEIEKAIDLIGNDIFPLLLEFQEADLKAHRKEYCDRKMDILRQIKQSYEINPELKNRKTKVYR